jgi:hypothetical protein
MNNRDRIDPRVTKADERFLRMSPEERYLHLIGQGHAFPTKEQCTDEAVLSWFESLGELGRLRLSLAQGESK